MIRANRQPIPDRKLFENLYKHNAFPYTQCNPDQSDIMNQLIQSTINGIQFKITLKFQHLEQKLGEVNNKLQRVLAYLKYKSVRNKQKIFSFANSPNDKSSKNMPESAKKYRILQHNQQSTQPNTVERYQNECPTKSDNNIYLFLNKQIKFLHQEIAALKEQLDRTHKIQQNKIRFHQLQQPKKMIEHIHSHFYPLGSFQSAVYPQFTIPKSGTTKQIINTEFDPDQVYQNYNQRMRQDWKQEDQIIARYKAIILQYQKQQEILRPLAAKSQIYKNGLKNVLAWLQQIKTYELPAYLPCQACKIKQFVFQMIQQSEKNYNKVRRQIKDIQQYSRESEQSQMAKNIEQYGQDFNSQQLLIDQERKEYYHPSSTF